MISPAPGTYRWASRGRPPRSGRSPQPRPALDPVCRECSALWRPRGERQRQEERRPRAGSVEFAGCGRRERDRECSCTHGWRSCRPVLHDRNLLQTRPVGQYRSPPQISRDPDQESLSRSLKNLGGSRYERRGGRSKAARRRDTVRIGEERQRRRWSHAAVTRRAQGDCGLIRRHSSSTMHRASTPPRSLSESCKTPVRDPTVLLQQPSYPPKLS